MTSPAATKHLLDAVRAGASYRIEGSEDWTEKPGRVTIWLDLDSETWDDVYDALCEMRV